MRQFAFEMIRVARSHGSTIVVNGSDASDRSAEYLERGADFVLLGEAERTLLELVESLIGRSARPVKDIPGLAYARPSEGLPVRTPPRSLIRDLDTLPFPSRDLVEVNRYRNLWKEAHGFFSLNLVASRGCPFRCNWCAKPIYGNSFHLRSAKSVAEEMLELRNSFGVDHLWFADDIFGINRRWILDFAENVERLNTAIPFKMQSRVDLMSEDSVKALARAGCAEVWMGVESGSQKVLETMEKGTRVEEIVRARETLRQKGIRACFFLQFGYPGETWADIQKTIQLVRRTRPDDIGVSVSYPLPGTDFYERVREQLGQKTNWEDSEDVSMMFKGAYTTEFYRALRDALHAEVDSWSSQANWKFSVREHTTFRSPANPLPASNLWDRVEQLEQTSKNSDATLLPVVAWSSAVCK